MTHKYNVILQINIVNQEFVNLEKYTSNFKRFFDDECTERRYDCISLSTDDSVYIEKAKTLLTIKYIYYYKIYKIIYNRGCLDLDHVNFVSTCYNLDDRFKKLKLLESLLTATCKTEFTFVCEPDIEYKDTEAYSLILKY